MPTERPSSDPLRSDMRTGAMQDWTASRSLSPSDLARARATSHRAVRPEMFEQYLKHRIDAIYAQAHMPRLELAVSHFYFLRHGQTEGNFRRVFQDADISLNATGRAQAERAAQAFQTTDAGRVVTSDMRRALQTGETVAQALSAPLVLEPRLRERWFGDLVGTSSLEIDWSFDPPNGDTLAEFIARLRAGVQEQLRPDEPPTVLVSHGGDLYALAFSLGAVLGPDQVENATPLRFHRIDGHWRVERLADSGQRLGASGV